MRFTHIFITFAAVAQVVQGATPPELILTNGRIYTVDAARPWAEAVAIGGTRIVAVGSAREIAALAGAGTRTIDLKGAFVSPGFSDSPGTNAARYFLTPVYGLYAAVSPQTLTGDPKAGWFPDQRLTIEEAIEAYTKAPAWASFEEESKGTITPGLVADLAVFDTNLVEVGRSNPAGLLKARVLYTIAGGRLVYQR